MELLRIVAMLLIMYGHFNLRLKGYPLFDEVSQRPFYSVLKIMSGCVSTTGVGIFIAISGWFGIRLKLQGVGKFLFQVLFVLWSIYIVCISLGIAEFNIAGIQQSLGFYEGYWFVAAYLGLYFASPVLNAFVDNASKQDFQLFLIGYILFQCYFSWLTAWYDYYGGYSVLMFCGIYLTAAYFRKYPVEWLQKNSGKILLATILLMTTIATLSFWKVGHAARQIRDDNPLVIFSCIMFLLCFNKFHFHSRFINWLAASCFAVYLIHFSPFVYPYLVNVIRTAVNPVNGILYVGLMLVLLLLIYFACVLFDQIRILFWKIILIHLKKL